jgi:hypothetical protein
MILLAFSVSHYIFLNTLSFILSFLSILTIISHKARASTAVMITKTQQHTGKLCKRVSVAKCTVTYAPSCTRT